MGLSCAPGLACSGSPLSRELARWPPPSTATQLQPRLTGCTLQGCHCEDTNANDRPRTAAAGALWGSKR